MIKTILHIIKKELLEIVRDRRTLFIMVFLPLLMYPLIMGSFGSLMKSQTDKAKTVVVKLGIEGDAVVSEVEGIVKQLGNYELVKGIGRDSATITTKIKAKEIDAAMVFPQAFQSQLTADKTGTVALYYESTNDKVPKQRLTVLTDLLEQEVVNQRLGKLGVTPDLMKPVQVKEVNVASQAARTGQVIGGILPYFFLMFAFLGCMYPAIDLFAGEKERGTIETLLTTPASRLELLLGKFGVVAISGFISAILSLVGLYLTLNFINDIPMDVLQSIGSILNPSSFFLLLTLLIPTTLFIASMLIVLSIYSQSYKEAQSKASPLMILIILPAMIGFIPGITLTYLFAMVPILNVTLACKEILMGTIQMGPLMVVYVSQFILAAVGIAVSWWVYGKEGNIVS